jgi:succinate dehydrogenase / fumarate reductase cytochrome b subunit
MSTSPQKQPRPLSPHLQIYRWRLTMLMSILHRASGAALAIGTLMVIWMLLAVASGEAAFNQFITCVSSLPGQVLLFGWSAALFYHMCNGVRHLFWDIGKGYEIKTAFASGYVVLLVAAILTGIVWCPLFLG